MPLPPTGSFQDAVLREVLERDRNRRFTEVAVVVTAIQEVAHQLLTLSLPPGVPEKERAALHHGLGERFTSLRRDYEDELYEDRYLPAYQIAATKRQRAAMNAALEAERRFAEARAKVAKLSNDT